MVIWLNEKNYIFAFIYRNQRMAQRIPIKQEMVFNYNVESVLFIASMFPFSWLSKRLRIKVNVLSQRLIEFTAFLDQSTASTPTMRASVSATTALRKTHNKINRQSTSLKETYTKKIKSSHTSIPWCARISPRVIVARQHPKPMIAAQ